MQRNDATPQPADLLARVGWPPPASASRITGGWDTLMWRVTTPDHVSHALRVYRTGAGRDTTVQARRESIALDAARAAGLPAPLVEAAGEHDGVAFVILSWMPGRTLADAVQHQLWRLWPLGRAFGRMQARLHRAPAPDGLRPGSPLIWTRSVREVALAEAVARAAGPPAFCHFDYHPLNVLAAGGRITALLDFVNATIADPRADLGVTRALLLVAPLPPGPLRPVLQLARRGLVAAWRNGYRAEAGAFPLTPLFEAWGAAYILRSIEEAVRDGRGWASPADVVIVRRYIAARSREAGLLS